MDVLLRILLVQTLSLVAFARFHRLAVLRQQLAVYKRSAKKPVKLSRSDNVIVNMTILLSYD